MKRFSVVSFVLGLSLLAGVLLWNIPYSSAPKAEELPLYRPPIMGWSSWNHYRANISEEIIQSQADALVQLGLDTLGYRFINIDDGFFGGRDTLGKIIPHPKRFPRGMRHLSDYIHSKGLKAGIYSDAGSNTCASYYDKDTIGVGMGLFGHDWQDLQQFLKEWNYDFIKVDWCGGDWLGLDEQSRYTEIGHIIKKIKPDAVYNVCRWKFPGKWVTHVADSWRISGDIDNHFSSIMHIVDINAPLWKYTAPGHYNDMDMLQVGRGMSYEEDKTHFTMWCIMNSPLLLGNDLSKISKETLEIISNKEIIELNQHHFVYQARRVLDFGDLEVWAKPLSSTSGGEVAVVLLNRSEKISTIDFEVCAVGLDATKGYRGKDLWSKKNFDTTYSPHIVRSVPAHGVVVLRLKGTSIPYNVFQYDQERYDEK